MWSNKLLIGTLLLGWGLFNLVEGVISHHLLGLHHVNETVVPSKGTLWDYGFLALGGRHAGQRLVAPQARPARDGQPT